jgi:carboxyvinyl-carboxyphosphonate phosphorylmutase
MNLNARRERFRAILGGTACIHPASVFDPISARLAEDAGYEAGMLAGSIASMTVLGAPDLTLLTLTEFAGQAYRICRAGTLPLLVDADHGYGNALNVARTVEELENAGVAALTIEDTELPQAFGGAGATMLIPLEEGVGKMRAALEARQDPALVIVGRTSAATLTGLADMIARCRAYEQAGVDAVFVTGLRKKGELEALRAEIRLPVLLGLVQGELVDRRELGEMGVRIALRGHQPFLAAVEAVRQTYAALREGAPPDRLPPRASPELMKRVTREPAYRRRMEELL